MKKYCTIICLLLLIGCDEPSKLELNDNNEHNVSVVKAYIPPGTSIEDATEYMKKAGCELMSQKGNSVFFNKETSDFPAHKRWQIELLVDKNKKIKGYKVYYGLIGL